MSDLDKILGAINQLSGRIDEIEQAQRGAVGVELPGRMYPGAPAPPAGYSQPPHTAGGGGVGAPQVPPVAWQGGMDGAGAPGHGVQPFGLVPGAAAGPPAGPTFTDGAPELSPAEQAKVDRDKREAIEVLSSQNWGKNKIARVVGLRRDEVERLMGRTRDILDECREKLRFMQQHGAQEFAKGGHGYSGKQIQAHFTTAFRDWFIQRFERNYTPAEAKALGIMT